MAITFITATDSTTVTVNDTAHGAIVGDFVTFANADTGNTTLNAQLNKEFEIQNFFGIYYVFNHKHNKFDEIFFS